MANWGQGLQGGLGGAATGAAIGSAVPGIGTGIGAAVGGVAGGIMGLLGGDNRDQYMLPGYYDRQRQLQEAYGGAANRGFQNSRGVNIGPMSQIAMGNQFRDAQLGLMGQLQQQAVGQGPSLAQMQFDQNLGQGINAQQALAASGRGNPALAQRQAASNVGGMTQNLAGQAAQARIQEQLLARQQLAGLSQAGRAQDFGVQQFNAAAQNQRAMQQAQMSQQNNQFNADAFLRNRALNDQYGLGLRGLELDNARGMQGGMMAAAQQPGLGTQLMAGGSNALMQSIAMGNFGRQPMSGGLGAMGSASGPTLPGGQPNAFMGYV